MPSRSWNNNDRGRSRRPESFVKFLIDASLPESLTDLLTNSGHEAQHVRDVGLAHADDHVIGAFSRANGACLLTGDFDFADVREFVPAEYAGIVVLTLPRWCNRLLIEMLVREFLQQIAGEVSLAGKLLIVEAGRIRLRN